MHQLLLVYASILRCDSSLGTPAIISGFMVGGWQGAFVQVLVLATSTVVYFPFFKFQDNLAYNNELQAEK